jgi:hypothetical protein
MKCFNNLNSSITITVDNSVEDNGTISGSTLSGGLAGQPVQTINTEPVTTADTAVVNDASSKIPEGQEDTNDDTPLTQSLNITNVTGFIDDTTNLNYIILRPLVVDDERKILSGKYYSINCSVGLYQTNILPSFAGSCIIEFYRTISTGDVVLDSKYLNIVSELNEISYFDAFNSWEYINTQPELDFTTTKVLRLNFNIKYFVNNPIYEDWLNLGVRVRGIDGSGNIGFCTAITLFTP